MTYFVKGLTLDDIQEPQARYERDGQAGTWFEPLHDTASVPTATNVVHPNDANIDLILEAPFPIDGVDARNFDAEGKAAFVHCAPDEFLEVAIKAYHNDDFTPNEDEDSAWYYHTVNHEETSCLGTSDELQLSFMMAARFQHLEGSEACFNNKKYGMPDYDRDALPADWHDLNVYDLPFTAYKNCFQMHYEEGEVYPVDCHEEGRVTMTIAVDDPVDPTDSEKNAKPIKES